MSAAVGNLYLVPIGERMAIVRPEALATDWAWQIVKRDDPSVVVAFSDVLIDNATRHVFYLISATIFEPNVAYELRILDNALAVNEIGYFQCTRAVFGPDAAVNFHEINLQLKLALGLAGLNARVEHSQHDAVTGIPLQSVFTIYTDEELTEILAKYTLKRRLNAVGLVVGEVMYRTEYDPSSLPSCPSENPSQPF